MTESLPTRSHGSLFRRKRPATAASTNGDASVDAVPLLPGQSEPSSVGNDSSRPATAYPEHRRRDSSISSLTELKSNIRRRSASLRGRSNPPLTLDSKPPSTSNMFARSSSPEKTDSRPQSSSASRPTLSVSTAPVSRQRSAESLDVVEPLSNNNLRPTLSAVETRPTRALFAARDEGKPPASAHPTLGGGAKGGNRATSGTHPAANGGGQSSKSTVQHIVESATKRISTIEYLRKVHEGRVYWFNALLFEKQDLSKMPYFESKRLSRRATNYLLLGLSIPAILDPNSNTAPEYLRAFNALLAEFESYQTIHPPDGSASASLSRARLPQMFKRATQYSAPKSGGRRGSTADGFSPQNPADSAHSDPRSASSGTFSAASVSSGAFSSFPGTDQDLLPGEEYSFLLTPSLPFDPDYFETFATLCDVLIDCYTKIMALVNTPETSGPGVEDLFSKADARVRKILMAGLVRDFEDSSKVGIKSEISGIGKMVMGGLMGS